MNPITFRGLITSYSQNVKNGYADGDVTPRQRLYLHILLNLASNNYIGELPYGEVTESIRQTICRGMGKDSENVRWFLNDGQEKDFDDMRARAIEILTSI